MNRYSDKHFLNIIDEYMNNEEFQKTNGIKQHGTTRYEHSMRVSYYSYVIARFLHLDYEETAIGGLLHDFFINPSEMGKIKAFFTHPKLALDKSMLEFDLSDKELDIIKSHMFPTSFFIPKYLESWIVSLVDKCVASYEFSLKFKLRMKYAYDLFLLFIISNL